MPQIFQVLKCYKCSAFQIHQTKKSNKFDCKMCGEKQSIKRHYGIGTGKDCRLHVQKLNSLRCQIDEMHSSDSNSDNSNETFEINADVEQDQKDISSGNPAKRSKWSAFLDKQEEDEKHGAEYIGDKQVVLEISTNTEVRRKPKVVRTHNTGHNALYDNTTNKSIDTVNVLNYDNKEELKHSNFKCIEDYCAENKQNRCKVLNSAENDVSCRNNTDIINNKHETQGYLCQPVSKSSKWAQFVYIEGEEENHCSKKLVSSQNITNNFFSLCDDKDLDDVLDF